MWNPGWRHWKPERTRLNELADQAETTADLLEIESQLSDVQYQLENYTRQLRNMDQQVSYSTVDIYLEEVATLTPTGVTFTERIADVFGGGWDAFVGFVQGLAHCAGLPVAGGADRHCSHCGSAILAQAPSESPQSAQAHPDPAASCGVPGKAGRGTEAEILR